MLPYWFDSIVPDLNTHPVVLVVAHGNSLRALIKHLENISDADIAEVNLPTGVPMLYELDDDFRPVEEKLLADRYLGDVEAAKAAAEAVARQAGGPPAPAPRTSPTTRPRAAGAPPPRPKPVGAAPRRVRTRAGSHASAPS